jgi:geranylgeranyl pyrophosphate synthase
MSNHALLDIFEAELQEVQSTLLAATSELTNPLGDLVRAQIRRAQPPICAAVILAVSMPSFMSTGTPPHDLSNQATFGNNDLRHKRILLAAALEMLHVALNVHRLLVNAALNEQRDGNEASLDRSFIGSTILAGDYCFSRAAQLAAQTENPRVVATFSLALQTVSEGLLREQFSTDANSTYDETRQLLQSGAEAAAQLVNLSPSKQQEAITLSLEFADRWAMQRTAIVDGQWQRSDGQDTLPVNWQLIYQWLNRHRTNGDVSTTASF